MNMNHIYLILLFIIFTPLKLLSQHIVVPESDVRKYVSDSIITPQKKPFRAVSKIIATNMTVWGFNRFIMNEDFSRIGFNSFKQNLSTLPVWDTDKFSTNLIAHPYHGGLYFNAARTNGISYWGSIPYTLGGSLMWEYFMENELPSINDLFSTTFGGAEIGEISYRLSDLFIDNRTTGIERIGRELLVTLISPVKGINRIITGESWKKSAGKGRTFNYAPIYLNLTIGPRFLQEQERSRDGEISMALGLNLSYGDPFSESYNDYYRPYEWFLLNVGIDILSHQPLLTQANLIGILWGKNIWNKNDRSLTAGIFQHLDFYDSQIKNKENKLVAPYRISEAVAFGGGLLYHRKQTINDPFDIKSSLYINGIVLGGSLTDHYFFDEKDYNLGSGYSYKFFSSTTFKKHISFSLQTDNYRIFTWKGDNPHETQKKHKSTQGDVGNSRLIVFTTELSYLSGKKWSIKLSNRYFSRFTNYKYYDDSTYYTNDIMLTFGYSL